MAVVLEQHLGQVLPQLRMQPTLKRVGVHLGDAPVAETSAAVLVWEPTRVVPSYAVPEQDVVADLEPAPAVPAPSYREIAFGADGPPVLDPSVPFAVHTAEGEPLTVVAGGRRLEGAAFRLADPDLVGWVLLDFDAFQWTEEDEAIVGHARDPFHRIDVRRSHRPVRIEHEGVVLAESRGCRMLYEGTFPMVRHYLPRDDVRVELVPGDLETTCAYKGRATHLTAVADGLRLPNIAWTYEHPLEDATAVRGLVCFYEERLDLFVDDEAVPRVRTPWS